MVQRDGERGRGRGSREMGFGDLIDGWRREGGREGRVVCFCGEFGVVVEGIYSCRAGRVVLLLLDPVRLFFLHWVAEKYCRKLQDVCIYVCIYVRMRQFVSLCLGTPLIGRYLVNFQVKSLGCEKNHGINTINRYFVYKSRYNLHTICLF